MLLWVFKIIKDENEEDNFSKTGIVMTQKIASEILYINTEENNKRKIIL